jgi:hypothetical protein
MGVDMEHIRVQATMAVMEDPEGELKITELPEPELLVKEIMVG